MMTPPNEKAAPMPGGGGEVRETFTSHSDITTTSSGVQEKPFAVSNRQRSFVCYRFASPYNNKSYRGLFAALVSVRDRIEKSRLLLLDGALNERFYIPPSCDAPFDALTASLDTALACCTEGIHRLTKLPED